MYFINVGDLEIGRLFCLLKINVDNIYRLYNQLFHLASTIYPKTNKVPYN